MSKHIIYYATNRNHQGKNRWRPAGYGTGFSADGLNNLRFGRVNVEADKEKVDGYLQDEKDYGVGDGEELSGYFSKLADSSKEEHKAEIIAYGEPAGKSDESPDKLPDKQPDEQLGSIKMFKDLRKAMLNSNDVLVYVHGFNVSWPDAVGAALALQEMLNQHIEGNGGDKVLVILFSWPSDGKSLAYRSDREEGEASSFAFARGLLKVRDFLLHLGKQARKNREKLCDRKIHLLCHSMGNFVLQKTLGRIEELHPGGGFPKMFEHIFLCAPDVDDDALEAGKPMERLHELARSVSVYYNRGDLAMLISDYTKSNPDRLGHDGAARPQNLHQKVHQIDCSPLVGGLVEHSYYLNGKVNQDLRLSLNEVPQDGRTQIRKRHPQFPNAWTLFSNA